MVKLSRVMVARSKDLRSRQTQWEEILWDHLRANHFAVKFKRQVVIGAYIFDFGAKRKKLLIELDGAGHRGKGKIADEEKIKYALSRGFTVLKFWNSEIERSLDKVLEEIFQKIQ